MPQNSFAPAGPREKRELRLRTARLSLAGGISLCLLKLATGILAGSLGLLASAADNMGDILMSFVNLISVRKAMDPADESHPYGHGKVETVATLLQGGVIALTGAGVVWEAVRRLREGVAPAGIGLDAGIFVMAFSMAASWWLSERIRKDGEASGSTALVANSLQFRTDVYSGAGVLFSLVLFRLTGWKWLDPGIALAVGVYIFVVAQPLLAGAAQELLDRGLPRETVREIERIIDAHRPMVRDYHALRTRRSGPELHVDFHVVMCRELPLGDAHRVVDHLEHEIHELLGTAQVVTHIDPCDIACGGVRECARVRKMVHEFDGPGYDRRKGEAR
ncbi:MAG: cation diffusion facilitator family transporter [Thermodesulfobacteriota bacterium]